MQVNSFQRSLVFKEALLKLNICLKTITQLQYLLKLIKKVKFITVYFYLSE